MKRFFIFLLAVGVLALSCTRESEIMSSAPSGEGLIPLNLGISFPEEAKTKASLVSGTEGSISSITLLCFNSELGFVGKYVASLNPATATTGTLRASISADTRTIHFIANKDLTALTPRVGAGEEDVLKNPALVSSASDDIAFWGYYSNANSEEFKTHINNTSNTVKLLRDRAKVEITTHEENGVVKYTYDNDVKSIRWIATNGLPKGYIVPYPFDNYWVSTTVTPLEEGNRYEAQKSDFVDSDTPLYLFEDANNIQQLERAVKLVLEVTYYDDSDPDEEDDIRYHNILLLDEDHMPLPITRNHTYRLTINLLPKEIGFETYDEALAAGVYSNNQTISVDRAVTIVTDGTNQLNITHTAGTSIMFHEPLGGGTVSIPFRYEEDSNVPVDERISQSDFTAIWLEHEGITASEAIQPSVTYNSTTGIGSISIDLVPITSSLKSGLILLQDKKYGLSRFVEVLSITTFAVENASFVKMDEGRTRNGESNDVYKLTFTLPEDYPASKYPIQLSMATSTLSPFSNNANSPTAASGNFSVDVRSTQELSDFPVAVPSSDASSSDWNYAASSWNYWYVYSIPAPASKSVEDRTVTIYFDDIRESAGSGNRAKRVGLYFSLPYFGDPLDAAAAVDDADCVTSITLDRDNLVLNRWESTQLTATVSPNTAIDTRVVWSSSDPSVATVNSDGVVTGVYATPGTNSATITATAYDGSGVSASCNVAVTYVPSTSVTITEGDHFRVALNHSSTLHASVSPVNASSFGAVTWSSNNPSVLMVDAHTGEITGIANGTATITATSKDGLTATCEVDVVSISLNKSKTRISQGNDDTLTATIVPSSASSATVNWNSSNTSIARVTDGVVTGLTPGKVSISASLDGTPECSVSCDVVVTGTVTFATTIVQYPNTGSANTTQTEVGGDIEMRFNHAFADVNANYVELDNSWNSSRNLILTAKNDAKITKVVINYYANAGGVTSSAAGTITNGQNKRTWESATDEGVENVTFAISRAGTFSYAQIKSVEITFR